MMDSLLSIAMNTVHEAHGQLSMHGTVHELSMHGQIPCTLAGGGGDGRRRQGEEGEEGPARGELHQAP